MTFAVVLSFILGLCTLLGLILAYRRLHSHDILWDKSSNVTQCKLTPIQRHNLELLQQLAGTTYDPENEVHCTKLRQVEQKYSDILCKSTLEPDWKRLGFQRSESPVTDFRGMGILTIDMLLHSKVFQDIQEIVEADGFPYSLVIITLTFDLLNLSAKDIFTGFTFPDYIIELNALISEVAAFVDSLVLDIVARLSRTGDDPFLAFPLVYKEFKHDHGWC